MSDRSRQSPPPAAPSPMPHSRLKARGIVDHRRAGWTWPPPGWGHGGVIDHMARHERTMALAKAITRPASDHEDYLESLARVLAERDGLAVERDDLTARQRELSQYGRDVAKAAAALRAAADKVLAMPGLASMDTGEMRVSVPSREAG